MYVCVLLSCFCLTPSCDERTTSLLFIHALIFFIYSFFNIQWVPLSVMCVFPSGLCQHPSLHQTLKKSSQFSHCQLSFCKFLWQVPKSAMRLPSSFWALPSSYLCCIFSCVNHTPVMKDCYFVPYDRTTNSFLGVWAENKAPQCENSLIVQMTAVVQIFLGFMLYRVRSPRIYAIIFLFKNIRFRTRVIA